MAIELILRFAQQIKPKYRFEFQEFSIGGGFGVQYSLDSKAPDVAEYAQVIGDKLSNLISRFGLGHLQLIIEPGRGIIAQAGVALYKVGAIKEIPGVRKYICIDGGMSDNIRPPLYGAKHEALVANKALEAESEIVTIAGKLCESGDILIKDTNLASVSPGDVIAVPVCGAYSIPMWSNYNALPRPAIVMVNKGKASLIHRRETYQDLISLDTI
jgi:diaminopimelate decarboxylase